MFDEKKLDEMKAVKKTYQAAVEKTLAKGPERKEKFTTGGGIPLERLYTPEDVQNVDYLQDVGFPGIYPYTRDVQPNMYRGCFWTMPPARQNPSASTASLQQIAHGNFGVTALASPPPPSGWSALQ